MTNLTAVVITGAFALAASVTGALLTHVLALRTERERRRHRDEGPRIVVVPARRRWWR
ncbi:hypothetical protein [Streptomyces pinistramenti]|uniref:hypothetical protein n=1 Tax=Streptomyces pinistramenti TaxID=2884812 RepID=UPI001D07CCD2|nr:hypothetical protein [Streptomyces pinistramenti]MCB5911547.1 hypothetical protein [Streptomyces pinistramenti]